MALSALQQAQNIMDRASSVLLIVPQKPSLDAIASMIAFYLHLADRPNINRIDEVSPEHVPTSLQFLAGSSQIMTEPFAQTELIVDITEAISISSMRQESISGGMRVHISLDQADNITKEKIETSIRKLPYDTIITFGATDLEELGKTFSKHADFFYNTPLINIDHRAANEHFGTVNLVDITAGSCAEATYELITSETTAISQDIATALYAGIIAGTDSFQKPSTTPRSFQTAATLVEQEADRETTIQHLVKTKPLKLIKLIGSMYAHLRHEEGVNLYWTLLEASDFLESKASASDIPQVMHELSNNIAGFNAAFLLYETADQSNQYYAYLLLGKGLKQRAREIQETLSATKENGALTFALTAPSIESAEKQAHEKIKQILP